MDAIIRTFIAVHIPDSIRQDIGTFIGRLKRFDADVKWVRPESMHLTLKFLGNIESERLDAIDGAVENAAVGKQTFDLALAGTGAFPNPKRPNVLWIGARQGAEAFATLAGSVESELAELGFEREKRPFSVHLTIGRVRSARNIGQVVEMMTENGFESGPFRIDAVHVMKSDLQRTGAVYTTLRTFKLQG
jgi:2'-5' RNA ligase